MSLGTKNAFLFSSLLVFIPRSLRIKQSRS